MKLRLDRQSRMRANRFSDKFCVFNIAFRLYGASDQSEVDDNPFGEHSETLPSGEKCTLAHAPVLKAANGPEIVS